MINQRNWSALEAVNEGRADKTQRELVNGFSSVTGGLAQAARDAREGNLRKRKDYAV